MSTKLDDSPPSQPTTTLAPLAEKNAGNVRVFRVKVKLQAPLDFAVSQLYRAWPKPRDRRDN
jgi:hypothetical protein